MTLYLVQHGDALSKDQDPQRPLSEKGRDDVRAMASFLAASGVRAARVYHSGKPRACDTALLLSEGICNGVVEEIDHGLAANDSTDNLKTLAERWDDDVMVVGHLPFMGRMVANLVSDSPDGDIVTFEPGSVVALEKDGNGNWSVQWMLRPSLL